MFEYIKGLLEEVKPTSAVVENEGIGYLLNISLHTYSRLKQGAEAKLFVHQEVREDAIILHGFSDKKEREIFRMLISVSGIGCNTARMMLSSLSPDEIQQAIVSADINLLKSIKGIGLKTAQRVVIELKDKFGKSQEKEEIFFTGGNTVANESLSALIMLGFNKALAEKVVLKLAADNKDIKVEELVKKALKML